MAGADELAQLKMESKTTLKASDIRIHDFSLDGRTAAASFGGDIVEQMARAARQAAQSHAAGAFKVSEVDLDFSALRADLGDEGPEAPVLREAKRLVGQQQFQPALAKLGEVFALAPEHPEATYLQAFCQHKLNQVGPALQTLNTLKKMVLSNRLQTCVRVLKEEIRQQILPKAVRIYEAALKGKEVAKAIEQLQQFADADPETGKFHCFLAGALFVGKRAVDARQAAAYGLEVCQTDRDQLQQLYQVIDRRCMTKLLDPARGLFRQKQYPAASAALNKMPADFRSAPLWHAFHSYTQRLSGKGSGGGLFSRILGNSAPLHEPEGRPEVVRELYEYLVELEMKTARAAINSENHSAAEKALVAALTFTPAFSLPNHMLATCVYQRVGSAVKQRIGEDLDDAKARELRGYKQQLDAIRENAAIGSRDREIADGARLLASIDEMRAQIENVVVKYEVQAHDAKLVNQLIDDFIQVFIQIIMIQHSTSQSEIRSAANELYSRLQKMRDRLTKLKRQCRGDEARHVMDNLRDNFVEPWYAALRSAMNR